MSLRDVSYLGLAIHLASVWFGVGAVNAAGISNYDGIYLGSARASGGPSCVTGAMSYGKFLSIKNGSGTWTASNSQQEIFSIDNNGTIVFGLAGSRFSGQATPAGINMDVASSDCPSYFSFSKVVAQGVAHVASTRYDGTYKGVAHLDQNLQTRADCLAEIRNRTVTIANGFATWIFTATDRLDIPVGDDGHFNAIGGKYYFKGIVSGTKITVNALSGSECPYIFDLQKS